MKKSLEVLLPMLWRFSEKKINLEKSVNEIGLQWRSITQSFAMLLFVGKI